MITLSEIKKSNQKINSTSSTSSTSPTNANATPTEIAPGLYCGSLQSAMDFKFLQEQNIRGIVCILDQETIKKNLLEEEKIISQYNEMKIERLMLIQEDAADTNFSRHFDASYDFITRKLLNDGVNVLVHCMLGVNRSPALVMAYLIRSLYESDLDLLTTSSSTTSVLPDVYLYVKRMRPSISPDKTYLQAIKKEEERLCNIDDNIAIATIERSSGPMEKEEEEKKEKKE